MRRYMLQRWSVILLLGARLVLGEFAHAMPHEHQPASPDVAVATSEQPPCHEDNAAPSSSDARHDGDCCKTSACECVCVHVSATATPSLTAIFDFGESRISTLAVKPAEHRLSVLFRPPA